MFSFVYLLFVDYYVNSKNIQSAHMLGNMYSSHAPMTPDVQFV